MTTSIIPPAARKLRHPQNAVILADTGFTSPTASSPDEALASEAQVDQMKGRAQRKKFASSDIHELTCASTVVHTEWSTQFQVKSSHV